MTQIEHDIIEQFAQLDAHAQQRILTQLHAHTHIAKNFDFDAWRQNIRTATQSTVAHNHALHALRELRAGEDDT